MITVTADTSGVRRALLSAGKQARFAIAKALTQVAKDAQQAVTASMPVKFDRPTPFTKKAMAIKPATKAKLESHVFVKDAQARYLPLQETGGRRAPKPGSPINLAVKQRINQYGNLPRGAMARLRNRKDTFVANGTGQTAHLAPGVYQRPKIGTRRDGRRGTTGASIHGGRWAKGESGLKLLVSFHKRADYQPRFGMQDTVKRSVQSGFKGRLEAALEAALRTSR